MKVLTEYALVGTGAIFFATAVLQFMWSFKEVYPRSVPTLLSIPACIIACFWCWLIAADISVSRRFGDTPRPPQQTPGA